MRNDATLTVRLPQRELDLLRSDAARVGKDLNEYVLDILWYRPNPHTAAECYSVGTLNRAPDGTHYAVSGGVLYINGIAKREG